MTREEKIKKVKDGIRKGMDFLKYPVWEVAEEIVDCLEEPEDDLTPGDICEVHDDGGPLELTYYIGKGEEQKMFSHYSFKIGSPHQGIPFDHYRKIDVFDLLPNNVSAVDLLYYDVSKRFKRLYRQEGR